jgi:hypothetical protein
MMNTCTRYKRFHNQVYMGFLFLLILNNAMGQTICVQRADNVPVSGKEIFYCEGKSLTLSAKLCTPVSQTVSYLWTYLDDSYISTKNNKFTVPDTGFYEIVITDKASILLKDTFHIMYYVSPTFKILTDILPVKCVGVPLTLKATESPLFSDYSWSTADDTTTLSRADTLFDAQANITYIVQALDNNACAVADTFSVYQSPFVPTVDLGPGDTTVCAGTTVLLKNLLPDNYDHTWSTGSLNSDIEVTTTGKYWLRVRNTFRCIAADTINVLVVPTPEITVDKDFYSCYGSGAALEISLNGDPDLYLYEWTPDAYINNNQVKDPVVTPPANTSYHVRVYTKAGCSDTASVKVFINPEIIASVNFKDTSFCQGNSVLLRGSATGGSPTASVTQPYTYSWTPAGSLNLSTAANVMATPDSTTRYTFSAIDSKGCYDTISLVVKISEITVKIHSSGSTICLGDSAALQAVIHGGIPDYTYQWSHLSQPLKDSAAAQPSIRPTQAGTYQVQLNLRDNAGCTAKDTFSLQVNSAPKAGNIPDHKKICVGDTSEFAFTASGGAGSGYTFAWLPDKKNILNPSGAAPSLVGAAEDIGQEIFLISVTDGNACKSVADTLTVETIPDYQVDFGKTDTAACLGTVVTLMQQQLYNKGLKFSWSSEPDGNNISSDSLLTITNTGQYKLTIEDPGTGCSSSGTKNIDFIQPPTLPVISADTQTCTNQTLKLSGSALGEDLVFSWQNEGNGSLSGSDAATAFYQPEPSTAESTKILLTVSNNCGTTDTSTMITVHPAPQLSVSATPQQTSVDSLVTFSGNATFTNLLTWNFGDDSPPQTGPAVTHAYQTDKEFHVFVNATNTFGCKAQDSLVIAVIAGQQIKELFIPTVFSPLSQDKDNNALKVFGKNISSDNFNFRIFNKWGEIIYQTNDFTKANEEGWNGNFSNGTQPVNVGLYTYTVKGQFNDGTPFQKAGSATLLK